MKITVLSKGNFNKLMENSNITPDNIESYEDLHIISINDTEGEMSVSYFENCDAKNVLCLYFDDTIENKEHDIIGGSGKFKTVVMSEEQGKEIVDFLSSIDVNDNTSLIIHCTAGQNRSGSVGKFAADFFNYGHKKFMLENPFVKGNSVVTRILNKIWMWSHYK